MDDEQRWGLRNHDGGDAPDLVRVKMGEFKGWRRLDFCLLLFLEKKTASQGLTSYGLKTDGLTLLRFSLAVGHSSALHT